MKKIIAFALVLILVFSLTACSRDNTSPDSRNTPSQPSQSGNNTLSPSSNDNNASTTADPKETPDAEQPTDDTPASEILQTTRFGNSHVGYIDLPEDFTMIQKSRYDVDLSQEYQNVGKSTGWWATANKKYSDQLFAAVEMRDVTEFFAVHNFAEHVAERQRLIKNDGLEKRTITVSRDDYAVEEHIGYHDFVYVEAGTAYDSQPSTSKPEPYYESYTIFEINNHVIEIKIKSPDQDEVLKILESYSFSS